MLRRNRARRRRAGMLFPNSCRTSGRPPARPSRGPRAAGPTSQAAANSSAVLARITAMYSSSVVAVFLASASCMTSPSAMTAAAEERISSALRLPTSTIILNAWPSRKSPTSTLASLPHSMRAASRPRRSSLSSTTSSCSSVAVCMNSTAAASLMWPSPPIAGEPRQREREHRPQPLTAGIDEVVGHLRDHRDFGTRARQNGAVDALHVGGDEIDQWVDRGFMRASERKDNGH